MEPTISCKSFEQLSLLELYRILQIRNQVFYVEQHCDDLDPDDRDQQSFHLCFYDGEILYGYARLLPPGLSYREMSIGRVAVSSSYRGRKMGRRLMEEAIRQCISLFGDQPIKISAQLYLKAFYSTLGFKAISEVYLEAGIEHIKMIRSHAVIVDVKQAPGYIINELPDMKQFNVPNIYRSDLISAIKNKRRLQDKLKKDFSPTLLDFGGVQIYLARHFGFCYGVENAIEIAFNIIDNNPDKQIYFLSEMIHNPQVNADLAQRGVKFLQDTYGNQIIPFEEVSGSDIVVIPAFGTTLELEQRLRDKGIHTEMYNTTCPFVEKVWNRSEQIARKGFSIVVHGKPRHEETRATFSHASAKTPTVIVNDMQEAVYLASFIRGEVPAADFYELFKGKYSEGFDVQKDLQQIGVVNQTTQLASETQKIADFLKQTIKQHYDLGDERIGERFADTRDTLCYATNDNQSAVSGMLDVPADFAIVVGGYNSSNTSHLVELCAEKLPTYFINQSDKIISKDLIETCDWRTKEISLVQDYMPEHRPVKLLITSGASCPDSIVEDVIVRILELYDCKEHLSDIIRQFA